MERNLDDVYDGPSDDAFMMYVVPFERWYRKNVVSFYTQWLKDNSINAELSVRPPVGNWSFFQRWWWRELHIKISIDGMTYREIYETYHKIHRLHYIEPLRRSMMEDASREGSFSG